MIKTTQITPPGNRTIAALVKSMLVLLFAVLFLAEGSVSGQVISNSGAAISVSPVVVVNSKDLENNTGSLGNNGTINLTGNYYNAGITGGNGFYNLTGNWTNLGTFNAGTSVVTLLGTTNQLITHGSIGETFYILTINNPGRIITQVANAGSSLKILNDLNLIAGTLSLGPTTANLTVGGKATLGGSLIFNNIFPQTASIADVLSGAGSIDMSGGSLPHTLNLAGATNSIGTFTTSAAGASTVNYNGTTQTVFPALNYRNLTISNSGIKTMMGNSAVGIDLNISGGTFDLGTSATSLSVTGITAIAGSLSFNNTTAKTVSLNGNLSGSGSIDMSGSALSHLLRLNGASNSIGSYSSGTGSTVNYILNGDQTVFTSDNYRNLTISGSGVKTLISDISASGILTMSSGDINSNGNILKVTNSALAAINRTSGKVIGKLQRAIGITGSDYLYPLGSATVYNPMKLNFQNLVSGPLTAQFNPGDIGTAGLPLNDNGNEIWDRYTTGYWNLTAVAPMASGNFALNLNYSGFPPVDQSASIIKRTDGGNLEIDGVHGTIGGSEITRTAVSNGISNTSTDFAIGKGRAFIDSQPSNIDICEGSNAFFEVLARGRGTLIYQWQVNTGSGFSSVFDGGVYSGAMTKKLVITGAPYTMNGYLYRCIIIDGSGNVKITNTVLLTVNKIPIATATPSAQNECPGVAFTTIMLGTSNGVTGTTFVWSRTNPAGITTNLPMSGFATGDQIPGTFTNTTDAPVTVTFTIIPTGPLTTFCIGNAINASVTVNPTPRVFAIPATTVQCDSMITNIRLTSPSTFTSGLVTFKYTVTTSGSVTGFTSPTSGIANNQFITDKLVNHTDVYQLVTYRVVPVSPAGCIDGSSFDARVTVNPTPRVQPLNNIPAICYGGTTQVVLTSPTVMTSGAMRFDYTVAVTGGPGIVVGSTATEVNRLPNYAITFPYQNNSDTIQSVYYSITPKVDNAICVPGPKVISEVKVHAKPLQNLIITKPLTCEGGADATLKAITSKGASLYYFDWSRTSTDRIVGYSIPVISNQKGGRWAVTVTDNLGCQSSDFVFVEGAFLDSYLYVVDTTGFGTTCPGSNDGQIWIKEKGTTTGIAPFEYWIVRDPQGVQDTVIHNILPSTEVLQKYTNLLPGTYKLFLKDANGCYDNPGPEASIIPPDVITATFKNIINPACTGYNNGSVAINTVTGGNGGYRYKWSTVNGLISGPDTLTFLDLIPAGTYSLRVTDRKGCQNTFSVNIINPPGMSLSSSSVSHSPDGNYNISCNGGNDGWISLNIAGGSGNYVYSWASPNGFTATTRDISGLKAGTYTCTIQDLNGCLLTPSPSFTLTEPAPLAITSLTSTSNDGGFSINCNGGTGSVSITVTGGSTGNYTYTWSTSNGMGIVPGQKDQPALTAGTYHLLVKDLNNCNSSKDITLTQPPSFATQIAGTNITCQSPGFNNGAANLTVTGGVAPYAYAWSNGASSEDISGLTQGYYHVIVTYNNTCAKSDSVRISLPPPLTYAKTIQNLNGYNVSCFGQADGQIQINPTSGLAPFNYSWTGPAGFTPCSSKDIAGLRAGDYHLLITDSNFCTASENITLNEPGRLGLTFSLSSSVTNGFNINCAGDSTGTITVNPVNQVNTVDYLWSDGATGRIRSNLAAGDYGVIITDANNCHASSSVTLTQPDTLKLKFIARKPFCPDKPDGEITLNVTGGVKGTDYYYKWSDNSTGSSLLNIARGNYKVTVTDLEGCSVKDSLKLEPINESCLIIPNAISPNNDLINDVWNIGEIELYPQMEITIFNRWGETLWRSTKGYTKPWDGKSNGADLPIDSYHYIIDLHNGSRPIVGNVTIVR